MKSNDNSFNLFTIYEYVLCFFNKTWRDFCSMTFDVKM